jgi:ssDNA-binding Zn-finger/Zn-ribbon topoisomerase 1
MAAKAPGGKKRPRRKRKLRLSLRQSKIKKADTYTDSLGWSTDVGRTLGDAPKAQEPETVNIQCDMCGSMLKIRKPTKSRYTVTCTYPECGNVMTFD